MGRKKGKRRGPKYPVGEAKKLILLIALDYSSGIEEPRLRDIIEDKTGIKEQKGIKIHLGELGPGIRIGKKHRKGKNFLIKCPPSKSQIENTWKPNKDMIREMAKLFSDGDDFLQFIRTQSVKEVILEEINKLRKPLPKYAKLLEEIIPFSPSAVRLLLLPEVKDILQASHYQDIEKHFSEKYPEIKDDGFLKIIIGGVIQDYLTGSEEIKKEIKNNCIGIKRVPFTDEEWNERLKELESENTKKSKKKS